MKERKKGKPVELKPGVAEEEEPEVDPEIQELAEWAEKAVEEVGQTT